MIIKKRVVTQTTDKPLVSPTDKRILHRIAYSTLADFEWIKDWQKTQSLRAEIDDLIASKHKTYALPLKKPDMLEKAKQFHKEYEKNRLRLLRELFANWAGNENPFMRLVQYGQLSLPMGSKPFMGYLPFSEVEKAISEMPENEYSLLVRDRQKAIDHIDKRQRLLEKELEQIFPKDSRFRTLGSGRDVRSDFVKFWTNLQSKVCEPVAVTGVLLDHCREAEISAHKTLGIGDFLKPDSELMAQRLENKI